MLFFVVIYFMVALECFSAAHILSPLHHWSRHIFYFSCFISEVSLSYSCLMSYMSLTYDWCRGRFFVISLFLRILDFHTKCEQKHQTFTFENCFVWIERSVFISSIFLLLLLFPISLCFSNLACLLFYSGSLLVINVERGIRKASSWTGIVCCMFLHQISLGRAWIHLPFSLIWVK